MAYHSSVGCDLARSTNRIRHLFNLPPYTRNHHSSEYLSDTETRVTNALGKSSIYHYEPIQGAKRLVQIEGQASSNCAAANRENEYDGDGRLVKATDWDGHVTRYEYNERGLVTNATFGAGSNVKRVTTTDWHSATSLPTRISNPIKAVEYQYDDKQRLILRSELGTDN
ncbi:RHS repeat protein [Marinobacter halodurans]|uniref:RHS repeat protein n=2 Tax=Marinobacter halodurans TaxID=2528979 RepID=A0ABY1ZF58_9GAMM|nr:RHS repeat protein [Marinobacter halodurans]